MKLLGASMKVNELTFNEVRAARTLKWYFNCPTVEVIQLKLALIIIFLYFHDEDCWSEHEAESFSMYGK